MINPSIENALVLRRIPRGRPIAVSALVSYVEEDLAHGIKLGAINQLDVFQSHSVHDHVRRLIADQTLIPGQEYRRWDAIPLYVSLSDSTAVSMNLQPGIKELITNLPLSGAGLLDLLAEEC